jgi:hypothetical protein
MDLIIKTPVELEVDTPTNQFTTHHNYLQANKKDGQCKQRQALSLTP